MNFEGSFTIHVSGADLSELLLLDCASCFTLTLSISYVQAAILNYIRSCYCTPWYTRVITITIIKSKCLFFIGSTLYFSAEFFGWIDVAYENNQTNTTPIILKVIKGGSVILECFPNTTESLKGLKPAWLHLTNYSIPLSGGNILLQNLQEDTQQECYWALRPDIKMRKFIITVATGE